MVAILTNASQKEVSMNYDEFVKEVRDRAGLESREEAERTATVVLQALSDRLIGGEADDLLAQLPAPLKERITVTDEAVKMDAEEFVARIAGDLGVPQGEARDRIQAVFDVLQEAVTPGEFDDVLAQLPRDYAELVV
jgi:uncharacterized protein (DUF2267 family)